jgi:hypothetical protein
MLVGPSVRRLVWFGVPLIGVACQKSVETPFPAGLEPLEDNTAPLPQPVDGDDYPEVLEVVTGDDEYAWIHARGYVKASVDDTWAAFQEPEVLVDRRGIDEWSFDPVADPEFDYEVLLHYVINDIVTVEFDIEWRQGVAATEDDRVTSVAMRYQKVEGSSFIEMMQGSVLLLEAADGVTEVQLIEHLDAVQTGVEDVESYQRDLFASVVSFVHGEPLPTYE